MSNMFMPSELVWICPLLILMCFLAQYASSLALGSPGNLRATDYDVSVSEVERLVGAPKVLDDYLLLFNRIADFNVGALGWMHLLFCSTGKKF